MTEQDSMLTPDVVARRYDVTPATVRRWCALGYLSGAVKEGIGNRASWLIPESALEGFRPPRPGRPRRK